MKRKKSFLKKITLLFVLFFLIHVGHRRHWCDKGCNSKSRTDGTIGACLNRANSICLNLRSQNVTSNKVEL